MITKRCQLEIEGASQCESRCDHCKEYYKPLDRLDLKDYPLKCSIIYADNVNPNTTDNMEDEYLWGRVSEAYMSGVNKVLELMDDLTIDN